MRRIILSLMRWLLAVPALIAAVLISLVVLFDLGVFHSTIASKISQKTGAKVKLGRMLIEPGWPVTFSSSDGRLEGELWNAEWKSFKLQIASLFPPYVVRVTLDGPSLVLNGEMERTPEEPGAANAKQKSSVGLAAPIHLQVHVTDGELKTPSLHIDHFDLKFDQRVFMRSQGRVHLKAFAEAAFLPIRTPVAVDSDTLTLSPETVKAESLKIALGGLSADVTGTSLISQDRHRWKAKLEAPDLAKLPQPPMNLPAKNWQGSVSGSAELIKENGAWSAEGDIDAKQVSGDLDYRRDKLTLQGPFTLDLQGHYKYVNQTPSIPDVKGFLDLSKVRLVYLDVLNKGYGVPMSARIEATGDDKELRIAKLDFKFWNLSGKVSGKTAVKAPYTADLQIAVPPLSLQGADRVFLPLSSSPVSGQFGFLGRFAGELMNPMDGRVVFDSFQLKNFKGDVNYDKPGLVKARGPFTLSLTGQAELDKLAVKQAEIKIHAGARDLALVAGPLRKGPNQAFALDGTIRNAGTDFDIQNLTLDSFAGRLKVSGKASYFRPPKVQLKTEIQQLDLNELRLALPDYREKIPKGTAGGSIQVRGTLVMDKPWSDWPLDVDGAVHATLPEYTLISETAQEPPPVTNLKAPPPARPEEQSFLPPGYLTSHLRLKTTGEVGRVTKGKLVLRGAHVAGQIAGGHFKGSAGVKEIFSGSVQVRDLDVPLIEARPAVQGSVTWQGIVIEDALGYAKPEYRDFATGHTAGSAEFATRLPSDPDFLPQLKAKGSITAEPVTLNSVKVGDMINGLIKQASILKLKPVKVDALRGSVKSDFEVRNRAVKIQNFVARDVDNSEMQLQGTVAIPGLQGDLAGDFFWSKPQVQGCLLEGNSDSAGRMIIPVAVKGDLMHPGLSSLQDLINKLGARALKCEQNKLLEGLKKDGGKRLGDELKKQLQNIFGQ